MRLRSKGEDGCMELVTKGEQNLGQIAKAALHQTTGTKKRTTSHVYMFTGGTRMKPRPTQETVK